MQNPCHAQVGDEDEGCGTRDVMIHSRDVTREDVTVMPGTCVHGSLARERVCVCARVRVRVRVGWTKQHAADR